MGFSTHVLDTTLGKPAAGIAVTLDRQLHEREWSELGHGETDADGRCRDLLPGGVTLTPGTYRVRFETAAYFERQNGPGLYPWVEIAFTVREGAGDHYHIPLLLTANGYSTYRGS